MAISETDVVIVGGGAAGLAAARALAASKLRVTILEARDRLGGRIHTLRESGFALPTELGAEFVHGMPAETWEIIRAAKLAAYDVADSHWFLSDGRLQRDERFWEELSAVLGRLKNVGASDCSFAEFLGHNCADVAERVKQMALAFVEGFDAADSERVSARSLADEQEAGQEEHEDRLFRLIDGYDRVIDWLVAGFDPERATVRINSIVDAIRWERGSAEVQVGAESVRAKSVLLTLPVGVWKQGSVRFEPDLPSKNQALSKLEMGPVMKTTLRFREPFWEESPIPTVAAKESLRDMCFMHGRGMPVFTWWTLLPVRSAVLVGWSGGPAAAALSNQPAGQIVDAALRSLSEFLGMGAPMLESLLEAARVWDWQADPFARGAYSYTLVGGTEAHDALAQPVQDTLFFAGEATHAGQSGTVAGAISSGYRAAREILERLE